MEGGGTSLLSKGVPASSRLNLLYFFLFFFSFSFYFFLHKEAQARNGEQNTEWGFSSLDLPGYRWLLMCSITPSRKSSSLSSVILLDPKTDSSRRAGLIAESPGRIRGRERVAQG